MIPAPFDYHAPASVKEASALLVRTPGAKILAGGMSLIPALKHRLAQPTALVDLGRVPGLAGIELRRGRIAIGACATHSALNQSAELRELPIFAETAALIGDVQVRNRGTLGGSLVHADPAADWPAVFLALDGEATALGPRGERTLAARDFFRGMLSSAVARDEILLEVRLALERGRSGAAYLKLRQAASGFALVGAAARVTLDRRGRCESVALALTGVNAVPFRVAGVERRLAGQTPDEAALRAACAEIEELDPLEDMHASGEYRRALASVYARRALLRASQRASA